MTVRTSNSAFLTVLDPLPLENIGWTVKILSERDYASTVAELVRFESLTFDVDFNDAGGGSVVLDRDDRIWTDPLPAGETVPLADQEALWQIFEDGVYRFSFLAEDIDEDVTLAESQRRGRTVTGRGMGVVLAWAIAIVEQSFTGSFFSAWLTLLNAAKARGECSWVTPKFTATHDSSSIAWTDSQTFTVSAGDNLFDLLNSWCEQTGAQWVMERGFRLYIRMNPGNHKENKVIFAIGRDQVDHNKKRTRREIANAIYVVGKDGAVSPLVDSDSVSKWRRRAKVVAAGDSADEAARGSVGNATLRLLSAQKASRELSVDPYVPGRRVFVDYTLGDWVGVEIEPDDAEAGIVQVRVVTVSVDNAGQTAVELTLGSRFDARAVALQRLIDKLGGGTVSGSAASTPVVSPVTPVSNSLSGLSDVNVAGAVSGDVLRRSGATWIDASLGLSDLSDLELEALTDGVGLIYNGDAGLWEAVTGVLMYQGVWVAGDYRYGAVVHHGGGTWVCSASDGTSSTPGASPDWTAM